MTILQRIKEEQSIHPKAQLRDYYKLVFQAIYGPGHLISDKKSAAAYLQDELEQSLSDDAIDIQDLSFTEYGFIPCGKTVSFTGNYCRVSLKMIDNGSISFDDYLSAFLKSAADANQYKSEQWLNLWAEFASYLRKHNMAVSSENQDLLISNILNNKPLASHSQTYRSEYKPHYRLIRKEYLNNYKTQTPLLS